MPRHNPLKEVPHGDSSGFRSWLRFDEKLERSLGIRPRRHSFTSAPLLGLVWQFHGVGSCCPSLGATGGLAIGGLSLGLIGFGGLAIGWRAVGGGAIGYRAFGGLALGGYAYAGNGVAYGYYEASGRQREKLFG